ncbi:helix-turn-helix transcriptional regulator [Kitasatospora sp. NRRL B-11411]|uniref:helix-turn-helix domain-containing protein n=1 Tax=Kitasatospora sp. NRRL B-11411 TaxID=1463822 RepID=UPI0004C32193|nr:helix-turn-helix transcriptional regulator [Kitasatospora sp. NRRL B-11411]
MAVEPTPRRRKLGTEVRHARRRLNWSVEEAAAQLGYGSASTISKIENGTQGIKLQQLPHFFEVLKITDPKVQDIWRDLVRNAHNPNWHQEYPGTADDPLGDYLVNLEIADGLFIWSPVGVHGLLQYDEYERQVILAGRPSKGEEDVQRFITVRRNCRHTAFTRKTPLPIWAVLTEGQLRQEVGGRATARAQVLHLIDLVRAHPNLVIQVIPLSHGAHAGFDGPFMAWTFPTGRHSVTIEGMKAALHLTDPAAVADYRTISDHLKTDALPPKESLELLARIAKDLT